MLSTRAFLAALIFAASANAFAQIPGQQLPAPPAVRVTQSATGFDATMGAETMHVTVCADGGDPRRDAAHGRRCEACAAMAAARGRILPRRAFDLRPGCKRATLKTAAITVSLALDHGNLTFATPDGKSFLREGNSVPRTYTPVTLNGQQTYHITDRFSPDPTEAIYGLGQHQSGLFNYRGATVELGQNNTDIAIPMLVSTNGYGIMWNTASLTTMDNRFPLELKFDSIAGDGIDYFVLYGPEFDQIIHEYRDLTGHAPMLPRWSYGFIQSKDRYMSLDEIQTIAAPLPRRTHPDRHHRAGLVLVGARRRPDLQQELPRRSRRPEEASRRALPHHDLHLGHDGSRVRDLQEARRRAPAAEGRARLRCLQSARPATSTGRASTARCSRRAGIPSGSTPPSRKSTTRIWATLS